MPLEETLRKVEYDIQRGDLEHAKQRLTGLLCWFAYPNSLLVRKKLGDIYYQLDNIIEAGRYWYLVDNKTAEMEDAIERYRKACGHNLYEIGRRLQVHQLDIHQIRQQSESVAEMLIKMRDESWVIFESRPLFIWDRSTLRESSYQRTEHYLIIGEISKLRYTILKLVNQLEKHTQFLRKTYQINENEFPKYNVAVVGLDSGELNTILVDAGDSRQYITPIVVDYYDAVALGSILSQAVANHGSFERTVVYIPDNQLEIPLLIASYATGSYFHILDSKTTDPNDVQSNLECRQKFLELLPFNGYWEIMLGFHVEEGGARWLTNEEVGKGVFETIFTEFSPSPPRKRFVGSLRPWSARPA